MGKKRLTPVQKRAISMLRNSGLTVNVVGVIAPTPSAPAERTFKTKAQIAAGDGYTCACGRVDLKTPVTAGRSYHKDPQGNLHDLR